MQSIRHRLAVLASAALFVDQTALAQPTVPVHTLDNFDARLTGQPIDSVNRQTIVIHGDRVDLANLTISPLRNPGERTQDIVIIAMRIRIGPQTEFETMGLVDAKSVDLLRGGDIYLVADTLEIDGLAGGAIRSPWRVQQSGGSHPSDPIQMRSRDGLTYVFANHVELAPEYVLARIKALNVGGQTNSFVPPAVLKIVSKGFSADNSIHRLIASPQQLRWAGFGDAFQYWMSEEPPLALVTRELNLVQQRTDPSTGANIPDVVGSMADAGKYLPSGVLAPWYEIYLERNATVAQVASDQHKYELALDSIRNARAVALGAPNAALTSPRFKKAVADLAAVEAKLKQTSIVEFLKMAVNGGPPVGVTIVRDLAASNVEVVPNQLLFDAITDNGVSRLGFVFQGQGDVRVSLRARLVVDPTVLELVSKRFPNATVRAADYLSFESLALDIGDGLKDGKIAISGTAVNFDLLFYGTQYRSAMLRLAQPFGIDAQLLWRHPQRPSDPQSSRVNVTLGRTEMAFMGVEGKLTNTTSNAVYVDYVLDGRRAITLGFPRTLTSGEVFEPGCTNVVCYAPGSAIRRVLPKADLDSWFVSLPLGSSILNYSFDNKLNDSGTMGKFLELVLDIRFFASPNAASQRTGSFVLGPNGSEGGRKTWSFIGSPAGGGKLEISGRAHWEQGYIDIPARTVESTNTLIDATWLKVPHQ